MLGHKTKGKDKRKRRPSWGWLTALVGLATLLIALWRAVVKRTSGEREQMPPAASRPAAEKEEQVSPAAPKLTGKEAQATQPAAPKSATKERKKTQERASPVTAETTSSEADTGDPSG